MALPGDRFVVRSYSPIVTIGGGTAARHRAAALQAQGPGARRAPDAARDGEPGGGAGGAPAPGRRGGRAGRRPPGADALRAGAAPRAARTGSSRRGRVVAVDREWYLHRERERRLRAPDARPARGVPRARTRCGPGCPARSCAAGPATPRSGSSPSSSARSRRRGWSGASATRSGSASHEIRLSPEQQRVVDGLEADFRAAGAAPPEPGGGAGPRAASRAPRSTSSSRSWSQTGTLVRVKESLFFHAEALADDPGRSSWPSSARRRRSAPPTSRTSSASAGSTPSRCWSTSTPSASRSRVGERRVFARARRVDNPGTGA